MHSGKYPLHETENTAQNLASFITFSWSVAMPSYWSNKDERQYKHVKQSELDEGRSTKRAEQIAAATVNKQRSNEGRTKNSKEGSKKGGKSSSDKGSRSGA